MGMIDIFIFFLVLAEVGNRVDFIDLYLRTLHIDYNNIKE